MGSKTSLTNKPLEVPGAGTYDTPEKPPNMKSAPRFGFGSSTRDGFKTLSVPGPGNYASKTCIGKDGPNFSMGALTTYQPKEKEEKMKPGPGAYAPDFYPTKRSEPKFKIGSEVRKNYAADKARLFQTSPG